MLLLLQVGVSYDSDLEKVEAVTLDVARSVLQDVDGGLPESDPLVRYEDFGYFSINFKVYLKIREFFDHLAIRHEFIKRLHQRYRKEGIKIPFPIQGFYVPDKHDRQCKQEVYYDSGGNFSIRGDN